MPEPVSGSAGANSIAIATDPYLQQLRSLTRPVPDLAATLTTQAEQDAEEENTRFLRSQLLADDDILSHGNDEDRDRDRRLREPPPALRPYTHAELLELDRLEERALQTLRQGYTGWAPGTSDDDDELSPNPARAADTLLDEPVVRRDTGVRGLNRVRQLRASQPEQGTSRHQEHAGPPPRHPSRFVENGMGNASSNSESSLRTTAMLRAVRRNTTISANRRSQLQWYILDRESIGPDADERDRQMSHQGSVSSLSPSQRRQVQREQRQELQHEQEFQQELDMLVEHRQHRRFMEEHLRQPQRQAEVHGPLPSTEQRRHRIRRDLPTPCPPSSGMSIDNTIRYLESLRLCESDKEGQDVADDSGFDPKDLCPHNSHNFLLDTTLVPPPPSSSWLQIGSVLAGSQHAMPASSVPFNSIGRFASESRSWIRHPLLGTSTARTTSPTRSSTSNFLPVLPPHLQPPSLRQQRLHRLDEDRWPVKVTIHSINHDTMTLAGTMEAFNVPDKSSPTNKSSITTYLEGEIIDFNKFTLETKSFRSDSRTDATYWRKLPPFRDMKDEDSVVKSLLSTEWLRDELMGNWMLMRWKEKHFVTPSDAQSSLTISGFYYISMRRYDGQIEGLYYDPCSTPYQHLSLKPEMRTFPAFEFR
ncbi:MAG: hypothetical protein Q9163_004124 [Psora crenata]